MTTNDNNNDNRHTFADLLARHSQIKTAIETATPSVSLRAMEVEASILDTLGLAIKAPKALSRELSDEKIAAVEARAIEAGLNLKLAVAREQRKVADKADNRDLAISAATVHGASLSFTARTLDLLATPKPVAKGKGKGNDKPTVTA